MSAADDVRRSKGPIDAVRVAYAAPPAGGCLKRDKRAEYIDRIAAKIIELVKKSPGITTRAIESNIHVKYELIRITVAEMVKDGRLQVVHYRPMCDKGNYTTMNTRGFRLGPAASDNV